MENSTIYRPLYFLVLFAVLSVGVRVIDLSAGTQLVNSPVVAQEQEETAANVDEAAALASGETSSDAATNAAETEKEAYVPDRSALVGRLPTEEELELISQLRDRRLVLDRRAQQLDLREKLLAGTEKRISDKIGQLEQLEMQIKGHLRLFEQREAEQLDAIVKVYETMKPKEAAPRFEALGLQTQLDIVTRMKPAKVAAIMAKMTPQSASTLTTELATLAQPPSAEDLQDAAGR